jgi:hypothetical protein
MGKKTIIDEVLSKASNRRQLIKSLGIASATATTSGSLSKLSADPSTPTPEDVVQFALNLEYLEAEFYSIATTGKTLEERGYEIWGVGEPGNAPGPTKTRFGAVDFCDREFDTGAIALDIAADEIAHVQVLRKALQDNGITPIAKPALDLDALAAAGASLQNERTFLVLSRIFEDVGESAYCAGAPFLSNSPFLRTAARITAVEGEHVSNVRLQIARLQIPTFPLDEADVIPPPSGQNYFSTNLANGLPPFRAPGEVLFLAYGNKANVTCGGFFPKGVNGALRTSTGPATAANLET